MQSQWESTKTNTQILICLGDLLDCEETGKINFMETFASLCLTYFQLMKGICFPKLHGWNTHVP